MKTVERTNWRASFWEKRAFSLIEVTLALGILAFGVVSLLGLFSLGLGEDHKSKTEMDAAHTASGFIAARRANPTGVIPGLPIPSLGTEVPTPTIAWANQDGVSQPNSTGAFYKVVYSIKRESATLVQLSLSLSHPATNTAALDSSKSLINYETLTYVRIP